MPEQRRRSARIPFVATAEIIHDDENARSSSEVSGLSLDGCCVKTQKPFPVGSSVTIEIYRNADFLESPATLPYSSPQRGMGLMFTGMEPQFAAVLKRWLAACSLPKSLT
jgi:hypothetical protein